jgi:hypothetical protein
MNLFVGCERSDVLLRAAHRLDYSDCRLVLDARAERGRAGL